LERDPAEREEEIRKLEEAGLLKERVDAYMESASYRADEEFKRQTMERYKQTDRYKAYEKRKLAELGLTKMENETKTTENQEQ
jgi:hypothetical protein